MGSPFNTPTPSGTVWYDTPSLHVNPGGGADTRRHYWVDGVSVWVGAPTDPLWTFNMPAENNPTYNRVYSAATFTMHGPATLNEDGGDDHLVILIDGNSYVEVWNAAVDTVTRTITTGNPAYNGGGQGWASGNIKTGPGAGDTVHRDGIRATNMSVIAGLITGRDISLGVIDHALAFVACGAVLSNTLPYYYPATAWESAQPGVGPVKSGSKIGIPAGVSRPAGMSTIGDMVFTALQTYGSYVGDYCGGELPIFNYEKFTVSSATLDPLINFWDTGTSDFDRMQPLLRVADYQP